MFRYDWTKKEILDLLERPLDALLNEATAIHKKYASRDIQRCELLSVKTGGCPEDCGYCSQSAHYSTSVDSATMAEPEEIIRTAKAAKSRGVTRFCLGGAFRNIPSDVRFEKLLSMIKGVSDLGLECCVTMGMATLDQLKQMKAAGLKAYNHNLDTSREFYSKIISTRTFDDRLETLRFAREAKVDLCSGVILGMGESYEDRALALFELASFNPHPESVPINLLVPIEGTPLAHQEPLSFDDFLRVVATARIIMPASRIRLSAGRKNLSREQQIRCFEAGANSIFIGEKLLTTTNVDQKSDEALFNHWETRFPSHP